MGLSKCVEGAPSSRLPRHIIVPATNNEKLTSLTDGSCKVLPR